MKQYRLNRLFHETSGRCLDVALDHGFFGEQAFLPGLEDIDAAVDAVVVAAPDAVQLTPGQATVLQSRPGRDKPALVLRTDVANVYGTSLPPLLFSRMIHDAGTQAVRLDAACVVVNLFDIPGHPEARRDCIDNILALKPVCDDLQLPLMIEPLVMRPNEEAGGYMVDGNVARVCALVRQATELGADVVKADPTEPLDEYHRVIEVARVPVLVRGGGRVPDDVLLRRTHAVIEQGAAGIVYGRNIVQHPDPAAITRALLAVVHDGVDPDTALDIVGAGPNA